MNIEKFGDHYISMDRVLYIERLGDSFIVHFDTSNNTFGIQTTLHLNSRHEVESMELWLAKSTGKERAS